jgi:hypothetical protein
VRDLRRANPAVRAAEESRRRAAAVEAAAPESDSLRRLERDLTDAERAECLHLEQAIRDEIRGRSLLSDSRTYAPYADERYRS